MSHSPSFAPGTLFEGRYEILSKLGEGGFGIVYKARQLTTERYVALKVMRRGENDTASTEEKRAARFLREMQFCAQLYHPHIVQLIDSGRLEAGTLYAVFAFAPGENLADVLAREGALDLPEAKRLMLQVLDALACAHAQGVIHRDLKPRNIMVLPTGARRNALVLDFGIGTLAATAPGQMLQPLTGTNEILGTPGYAAPEQLRGHTPTLRSDLFSWGLILIECLTGERVYSGQSTADILYAQLSPDPVPIPRMLERHPLGALLRRVTQKDVALRKGSLAAIYAELEATLSSAPLHDQLANGVQFTAPDEEDRELLTEGTTLAASHPSPARSARPVSPMGAGERRQITALSCSIDVRAGTSSLDLEAVDELVRVELDSCTEIARRYGGHFVSALGDQALVYFGYPRARENDASRAARAAMAIASMMRSEAARLAAERGLHLELRLGLHTGFVLASEQRRSAGARDVDAGVAVGSTSRIAAWLGRNARPGTIAVTADAQRLLRASFDLDAEDAWPGDGAPPSRLYLLRQDQDSRPPTPTPASAGALLVGRTHEMEILLERWSRTRHGEGQCILLTGEPGIGKSRLGRELRHRIGDEALLCLDTWCSPDAQHSALHPIIELLQRVLGLDRATSPADKIARLAHQLAGHGFTLASAMPLFLPLLSLPIAEPYAPLDVSPSDTRS